MGSEESDKTEPLYFLLLFLIYLSAKYFLHTKVSSQPNTWWRHPKSRRRRKCPPVQRLASCIWLQCDLPTETEVYAVLFSPSSKPTSSFQAHVYGAGLCDPLLSPSKMQPSLSSRRLMLISPVACHIHFDEMLLKQRRCMDPRASERACLNFAPSRIHGSEPFRKNPSPFLLKFDDPT